MGGDGGGQGGGSHDGGFLETHTERLEESDTGCGTIDDRDLPPTRIIPSLRSPYMPSATAPFPEPNPPPRRIADTLPSPVSRPLTSWPIQAYPSPAAARRHWWKYLGFGDRPAPVMFPIYYIAGWARMERLTGRDRFAEVRQASPSALYIKGPRGPPWRS